MLLAIIGLVCLKARVKFKNIDFQTKADFACYYIVKVEIGVSSNTLYLAYIFCVLALL
jgi:hypothetical protein